MQREVRPPHSEPQRAPVAIGGVGGSGTRLIAQLVRECGFWLGGDVNESNDTLWFTLLFKDRAVLALDNAAFAARVRIFVAALTGGSLDAGARALVTSLSVQDRLQHPAAWLAARAQSLLAATDAAHAPPPRWGWKEPNTHRVLDRLNQCLPNLRYIHVMRNGLDMAFSANQNQLALWGAGLLGREVAITPHDSLAYWCAVHRRVRDIGASVGARFLLLNYDDFCGAPEAGVRRLLDFLEVDAPPARVAELATNIVPPSTIGRYRNRDCAPFDPADIACVRSFGFDVDRPSARHL